MNSDNNPFDEIDTREDNSSENSENSRFKEICVIIACVAALAIMIAMRFAGYELDRRVYSFHRSDMIAMSSFF